MNLKITTFFSSLVLSISISHAAENIAAKSPIVLKWMVAHSPNNYFVEMAKYFKTRVENETNKRVMVEIVDDFENEKNLKKGKQQNSVVAKRENLRLYIRQEKIAGVDNKVLKEIIRNNHTGGEVFLNRLNAFKMMKEGKIDMAQGYTYFLAQLSNPDYHALELPFLFDDYEHIERFTSSTTGKNLLASTADKYGFRGLAYTFSGGLLLSLGRGDEDFSNISVWNQKRFRTTGSVVRDLMLQELGTKATSIQKTKLTVYNNSKRIVRPTQLIANGLIDGEEINLPDVELLMAKELEKSIKNKSSNSVAGLAITETQHVLLSTVFLINEKSFQKINSEDRVIVQRIAEEAAKRERELTISKFNHAKTFLLDHGQKWNYLSLEKRNEFVTKVQPVYSEIYKRFPNTKKLVEEINALKIPNKKMAGN